MGRYNIIYADPPWPYNRRSTARSTRFGAGIYAHYDPMTERELLDMRPMISHLAADDCALFMWTTSPRQPMAERVGEHWGFRYATKAFQWIKVARSLDLPVDVTVRLRDRSEVVLPAGTRIPWAALSERAHLGINTIVGPGNYSGSNGEDCLLFVRGSMPPAEKLVPQIVIHPRLRPSEKPAEVRDRIVRMCGDLPRIELFARERAPGWEATGLQLDGTDYTKCNA